MNDKKINDWEISTPEEQGMDHKILSDSDEAIKKDYRAVTSLLVVRHGFLVYEKYHLGKSKDDYSHVFSVTKSVISALTGIAIREKFLTGLDQKMSDFYPEYFQNADPKKKEITIKQMLTMTAGLEPVDKNYFAWQYSNDWFEYALNRPLVNNPGEGFGYNTGLSHLLGGVIAWSAKMSVKEFADQYLFGPLGITNYKWDTDPKGNYSGGTLWYLTPRDMAKFGYLYLKGGKWQDKQVVPENWVKESTIVHADPGDGRKYGYLWWLENKQDKLHDRKVSMFSAVGYGGQFITVVPELDLVAVILVMPIFIQIKGMPPVKSLLIMSSRQSSNYTDSLYGDKREQRWSLQPYLLHSGCGGYGLMEYTCSHNMNMKLKAEEVGKAVLHVFQLPEHVVVEEMIVWGNDRMVVPLQTNSRMK